LEERKEYHAARMSRVTVRVACAASLAIGLFFVFVRAPHPWGWEGFDDYHDLGRALARGDAFPTIDRPWGYAYFLAAFYRLFGDRPQIPIVAQVLANAFVPLIVYAFARVEFDERVAAIAAILTGFLSFNTVYASTQVSDALCTVIFMAAVLAFARGRRRGDWRLHALAGALAGIAAQFRPNLVLVPALLAALLVGGRRDRRAPAHAAVLVAAAAAMFAPWMARTYALTHEIVPATTHGAMQLWYGTLQTGPYLKSRAHNPRSVFETGSFPYTSLDRVPLVVTGRVRGCAPVPASLDIVYWTDRDPARRRVRAWFTAPREFRADIPPSPAPTVYYVTVEREGDRDAAPPFVYFVSDDHLGDLDRHADLLDVFDVVRLLRHAAWGEAVPAAGRLDLDGDGRLSEADARLAADALLDRAQPAAGARPRGRVDAGASSVALRLDDGSSIVVPRAWSGRITDVGVAGADAERVLHASVPFAALAARRDRAAPAPGACDPFADFAINAPFYREQLQAMRRYSALAIDNIRRDPPAFLASSAYRAVRVFFVEGSDDPHTTQQFAGSGRVYGVAHVASLGLVVMTAIGVWAARRRGAAIALPLALILYIPATLAFVLTNMRYSITVQPLMFMFVAAALAEASDALARKATAENAEIAEK